MNNLLKEVILQKMRDPAKPKKATMPNFLHPRTRPNEKAILPYEVYNTTPYSENNVITTLNEMEAEGIIQSVLSRKKDEDVFFYYPK